MNDSTINETNNQNSSDGVKTGKKDNNKPGQNGKSEQAANEGNAKKIALVFQGGGAMGAYQAGVYETLYADNCEVTHIGGISIGAINTALIAGNPPEKRVAALKSFWERVSSQMPIFPFWPEWLRTPLHESAASFVTINGAPGMFSLRPISPFLAPSRSMNALSFYDTQPLINSLNELVDWDLLNDGPVHVGIGAVDVETGQFHYFDNRKERLDARHISASGSLPPGFPPTELDGKLWWDGGVVSNTPLIWLLDVQDGPMQILQVDLFSAAGERPKTIMDVATRHKDIQYSSRTNFALEMAMRVRERSKLENKIIAKLPDDLKNDEDVKALIEKSNIHPLRIGQLIYSARPWEGGTRDYEFSRRSMLEHWEAGRKALDRLKQEAKEVGKQDESFYNLVAH